ncbi:type I-E CRISPR-associated endonuclease Cas1e [Gephyromycinifex aptenodytis]|uniref:type I-E CRISPR-associated endonuclease Cas1e n=1 Tax=Gephyromycinifex aptenodytis TaxID=2716227 RepID=UPI001447B233|nr:type I-E CRISPR-associated endonuclease Cas1e [Gephyromycinifex aptenodytis]
MMPFSGPTPLPLQKPRALLLTRVDDRLSFLYLDRCAIHQSDNGTVAVIEVEDGSRSTQIPVATLTSLMLGPGTSITQQAAAHMAAAGCAATFVGGSAVRSYGAFLSPYAPADRLQRQALVSTDPDLRAEAARRMYLKRFPGTTSATFADASIEQMRGIEGLRMRAVYEQQARKHRLRAWRRNTGTQPELGPPDSVNMALNAANSALYGIVNSVVLSLGLSPGLGIIHSGNRQSFTLDIADLYKTRVTVPLAFSLKDHGDPFNAALRTLREELRLLRLLPQIVNDIDMVLGIDVADDWSVDALELWGPAGEVEATWSHAEWSL